MPEKQRPLWTCAEWPLWDLWRSHPSGTFLIRDLSAPTLWPRRWFQDLLRKYCKDLRELYVLPCSPSKQYQESCKLPLICFSLVVFVLIVGTNVLLWWWQVCEQQSRVSDSLCGASYHQHKRLNDMLLMNTHTHTFSLEGWTNQNRQQQQQLNSKTHIFNECCLCWLCCRCDHMTVLSVLTSGGHTLNKQVKFHRHVSYQSAQVIFIRSEYWKSAKAFFMKRDKCEQKVSGAEVKSRQSKQEVCKTEKHPEC